MVASQTQLRTNQAGIDWHKEEIKAAIRMSGLTLSALSLMHGYRESAVKKALARPWPAVERIIADHLSVKPQEIWPSRYDANGHPRRGRLLSPRKSSRPNRPSLRQKRRAA